MCPRKRWQEMSPKAQGSERLTELRQEEWEPLLVQQGSSLGEEATLKLGEMASDATQLSMFTAGILVNHISEDRTKQARQRPEPEHRAGRLEASCRYPFCM